MQSFDEPEDLTNFIYDPLAGLIPGLPPQMRQLELTKHSRECATHVAHFLVENAIFEARANELMQYVDSFGTNHTIESGMIPVMTLNLPKDVNVDNYPYAEDVIEPVSFNSNPLISLFMYIATSINGCLVSAKSQTSG